MKRALFSVYKKDGIEIFANYLARRGYEIVSSGGTYKYLKDKGVEVTEISTITGFPEVLGGRVKTLHPAVHAGILACTDNPSHIADLEKHKIEPIEFVVVSLYPFEETAADPKSTPADIIEQIDIGGVTLIRAAAKNCRFVNIVVENTDFEMIMEEIDAHGSTSEETRLALTAKAFGHTAYYDGLISNWYLQRAGKTLFPKEGSVPVKMLDEMRYGENPHQAAALYVSGVEKNISIPNAMVHGGKKLSYNNIMDADAAVDILREFQGGDPFCVIIKHTNPCGASVAGSVKEAYERALAADPDSAFGGIIGLNTTLDSATAAMINERFYEIVIATGYAPEALEILKKKQNLRIIEIQGNDWSKKGMSYRRIEGGMLVQGWDHPGMGTEKFETVTANEPKGLMDDLKFAWIICKHVKSNAIVYARGGQVIGAGAGQTKRVDSARIAAMKAKEAGFSLEGSVMASDAFFPFRDTVDSAAKDGVKAIIQPGGSMRDRESIDAANDHGIAMVFTGVRHFRH
ncbi:MAG: bifunctional phosphoribosylaminoimidazolecarboxamide formyltransferase/IMP cyclohydrolase [Spirochaetes bacterium GWF1_51_8]|nr:MAG: bifunctional phosphoribosylaminoimidazolecarboxamide formyltransferase/IMP cyclohydrolase [Spirochaetes bacterium GWF1_51_8]